MKHGHPDHVVASHHDMLTDLLGSKEESAASVVYNYKHGFSGFAATLTPEQAKLLAGKKSSSSWTTNELALISACILSSVVEQLSCDVMCAEFPEVISVERSKTHTATTTRSWDFLGVNYQTPASGLLHGSNYGEDCVQKNYGDDVIIGVVDTG